VALIVLAGFSALTVTG